MLLNETGLVRAIKRAYKNAGYTVSNQDGKVAIYTQMWYVQTRYGALPRKALAAIAEHMGMIPDEEPVFIIKDGDPQIVIAETAGEGMNYWRVGERGDVVDMVPVIMQGFQIFQAADGPCWGIPLSCLSMIERDAAEHRGAIVANGDRLVWDGDTEVIAVRAVRKARSGPKHGKGPCGRRWRAWIFTRRRNKVADRVICKYNSGLGCEDTTKCGTCGWNPEVAKRRIRARSEAGAEKQAPVMTYFQKITASQEALAAFLSSIQVIDGPWDFLFQETFCTKCLASSCNVCPHEAQRRNPAWFLKQKVKVADDGNDPVR